MIINKTQPIEVIFIKYYETNSTVMGYHSVKKKLEAVIVEVLEAKMEPRNDIDKYASAVCKKGDTVAFS